MKPLALLAAGACLLAGQDRPPADFERALAVQMRRFRTPGASVAVIRGGRLAWAAGYGVRVAGGTAPVDQHTIFQAASLSKAVAAMAALHLSQHGHFGLDEDLRGKFTGWRPPASEAAPDGFTLRQLASHTAGFTVSGFPGYAADEALPSLIQILQGQPPANTGPIVIDLPPGTRPRYSGGGYTVMQKLMIDRLQRPFPEIMSALVLKPLAMRHSTFRQPPPKALAQNLAQGHDLRGRTLAGGWRTHPEMAAAGLWTTPTDYARFLIELWRVLRGESERVVAAPMAREMTTPVLAGYALGVMVRETGTRRVIEHGGSNIGYRCWFALRPDSGDGFVGMANGDGASAMFAALEPLLLGP